jgi:hypothetical protein
MESDWGDVFRADAISAEGRRIKFSIPSFSYNASYDGRLSEDGNSIDGTYAFSDGWRYDALFTLQHPMQVNCPKAKPLG